MIGVSVQHNDGFLPVIILLTQPMLLPSGNPFKCQQEVLSLQHIIPPINVLTFSPQTGGMLRRSRCVHIIQGEFY